MDVREKAIEIDKFLRDKNITIARKTELRAMYNIDHNNASPLWGAMESLGWKIEWNYLKRK